ncbi:unnamed protein product [Schistocephalus solidus]|uniref:Retrovirus-related Pol polyprotein from transposon TNT 1-94 n=1 Tax=Schistocephalus solidus TaxID=70667 RepID=A0A183TM16_SCHSO|nr:unnamed protein product [Schistocephalus solidus]
MGDNLLGKLVKELQKLTVPSALPPEKLTRETNFARWKARCKDFLQGLDARAHSGAILALLDDEVYDLALFGRHLSGHSSLVCPRWSSRNPREF